MVNLFFSVQKLQVLPSQSPHKILDEEVPRELLGAQAQEEIGIPCMLVGFEWSLFHASGSTVSSLSPC